MKVSWEKLCASQAAISESWESGIKVSNMRNSVIAVDCGITFILRHQKKKKVPDEFKMVLSWCSLHCIFQAFHCNLQHCQIQ